MTAERVLRVGSISVVIPARNASVTIRAQLEALDRQHGQTPFEVLVVDNGSSDGTGDVVRAFEPSRYALQVLSVTRPGINVARNYGVQAAPDGLVLLCDADDVVSDGWVEAMASASEAGIWLAGVVDYCGLNSEQTRLQWGAPERSEPAVTSPFVDRTFGCNCGFLRSMWVLLGGFDERLSGIGGDETELFMRAYAAGFHQRWVPDAVVAYRLRPGVRNMLRQRYRQGRNQVRMSRLAGGKVGPPLDGPAGALRSLAVLLFASPKYATSAERRFQWAAAASRHIGRLAGHCSRWPD